MKNRLGAKTKLGGKTGCSYRLVDEMMWSIHHGYQGISKKWAARRSKRALKFFEISKDILDSRGGQKLRRCYIMATGAKEKDVIAAAEALPTYPCKKCGKDWDIDWAEDYPDGGCPSCCKEEEGRDGREAECAGLLNR